LARAAPDGDLTISSRNNSCFFPFAETTRVSFVHYH
jgi:hypothetical protein